MPPIRPEEKSSTKMGNMFFRRVSAAPGSLIRLLWQAREQVNKCVGLTDPQ